MEEKSDTRKKLIHPLLFIITLVTTTIAGAEWMYGRSVFLGPGLSMAEIWDGLEFSIPFLGILTVHEFGHYFTARYYQVKSYLTLLHTTAISHVHWYFRCCD